MGLCELLQILQMTFGSAQGFFGQRPCSRRVLQLGDITRASFRCLAAAVG